MKIGTYINEKENIYDKGIIKENSNFVLKINVVINSPQKGTNNQSGMKKGKWYHYTFHKHWISNKNYHFFKNYMPINLKIQMN